MVSEFTEIAVELGYETSESIDTYDGCCDRRSLGIHRNAEHMSSPNLGVREVQNTLPHLQSILTYLHSYIMCESLKTLTCSDL